MNHIKQSFGFVVILVLAFGPPLVNAQSEEELVGIPAKAQEVCAACHGLDGNKSMTPDTPKIGGQASDYLAEALEQYKNGMRNHPIMGAMAAGLTSQDIQELSNYFASQTSQLFSKY